VQVSDTRNSQPSRILDYFWYQKFAQWLKEESLAFDVSGLQMYRTNVFFGMPDQD
jgi:hypothetical protein